MSFLARTFLGFPVSATAPAVLVIPLADEADMPSYAAIVAEMRARPFAFGLVPRFVVLRDEDHAAAWLDWYTRLQLQLFRRDLDQSDKRLALAINRSEDWSTLAVSFRLATAGVAGFTQYRIFMRRISNDLFACRE